MRADSYLAVTVFCLFATCALPGCTSAQLAEKLPSSVGLPADTPARPATPYEYPAVHDMPPPRADTPLTKEEQTRLEKELTRLHDKQEGLNAQAAKPKRAPKKKPSGATTGEAASAKTNP